MPENDLSLKPEQVARNKTDINLDVVENLYILCALKLFLMFEIPAFKLAVSFIYIDSVKLL
jgi:hypothetical protein